MPKILQSKKLMLQSSLQKQARILFDKQLYQKSCQFYQQALYLNCNSAKLYQKYLQPLKELKKFKQAETVFQHVLELLGEDREAIVEVYKDYVAFLGKNEMSDKERQCVYKILQLQPQDIKILTKYANLCHKTKKFQPGLAALNTYQHSHRQKMHRTSRLMLWKVYLSYQLGDYQTSYTYCKIVLTQVQKNNNSIGLSKQDIEYYRFQLCKYCAILGKYQESVAIVDQLLGDSGESQVEGRCKLKVLAIKIYCCYSEGKFDMVWLLIDETLRMDGIVYWQKIKKQSQSKLQDDEAKIQPYNFSQYKDEMLKLKTTLFKIMLLQKRNESTLRVDKISVPNLRASLLDIHKNMLQCTAQNFSTIKYSQHFNWYQELCDYRSNLQSLVDAMGVLEEAVQMSRHDLRQDEQTVWYGILGRFGKVARYLFMSLLQGNQDCVKTNIYIKQNIKNIKQLTINIQKKVFQEYSGTQYQK